MNPSFLGKLYDRESDQILPALAISAYIVSNATGIAEAAYNESGMQKCLVKVDSTLQGRLSCCTRQTGARRGCDEHDTLS